MKKRITVQELPDYITEQCLQDSTAFAQFVDSELPDLNYDRNKLILLKAAFIATCGRQSLKFYHNVSDEINELVIGKVFGRIKEWNLDDDSVVDRYEVALKHDLASAGGEVKMHLDESSEILINEIASEEQPNDQYRPVFQLMWTDMCGQSGALMIQQMRKLKIR